MSVFLLIIAAAYLGCVGIPAARRYDRAMQDPTSTTYQDTHTKEHQS